MRRLFADREFSSKHQLMTLNSINFTRVLIHVVHHVYGFLQVCPEADREVVVAVPCGALGTSQVLTSLTKWEFPSGCLERQTTMTLLTRRLTGGHMSCETGPKYVRLFDGR